jgi:hypothetical protein
VVNTSVMPPESSDEKANRRRPSRSESVEDATITTFGNHSSVVVSDSCGDEHSCYRPSPDPTLLLKATVTTGLPVRQRPSCPTWRRVTAAVAITSGSDGYD